MRKAGVPMGRKFYTSLSIFSKRIVMGIMGSNRIFVLNDELLTAHPEERLVHGASYRSHCESATATPIFFTSDEEGLISLVTERHNHMTRPT